MPKLAGAAIAAGLLITLATSVTQAADLSGAIAASVVVVTQDGHGTGFNIGKGQILTAAHVTSGSTTVTLNVAGEQVPGTVTRSDPGTDLAIVTADVDLPTLKFADRAADVGDAVYAIGAPVQERIQVSKGIVSANLQQDGLSYVQTDAAVNPGNSGGPLVNESGYVIGVVLIKDAQAEGVGLALAASEVARFLSGAGAKAPGTSGDQPSSSPPAEVPPGARALPDGALMALALGVCLLLVGLALKTRNARKAKRIRPILDLIGYGLLRCTVNTTVRIAGAEMANLNITITDATGTKTQDAVVPADAPIIRVLARVVQVLNLPLTGPDGQPLSYKFHHRATGRQLRDEDTLATAGVSDGDVLRLVAEITAG